MKTISSSNSPFSDKTFVLELGRDIRFKAKQELINYLREQNAHISFILTASTDYVLVSSDIDTYKTRRAKQLGIPLVNIDYIYECQSLSPGKEPVDIKRFIVTSSEDKENFSKSGTIPVSGGGGSSIGTSKPIKFDLSKIKIWNSDDIELPRFDELTQAEIGKWAIFKETNDNSDVYFALELQIISEGLNNDYRLRFRYEKQTITSLKGKISLIQYAFSNDINELQQLFASYYYRIAIMPRITRIKDLLPDKLGSKLLLRSLFLHRIDTQMLDENVCQLIESIWIESIGDLNKILSVQPESIALKTIIEAEAALLEIKCSSESSPEAETRFYSLIPHRPSFVIDLIKDRRALIDKIDLCQMLRDMLTVNELTNWNIKASIEAKYRALKCHIELIKADTHEYKTICNTISSSTNQNEEVIVHQIYSVAKQTDALNFRSTLFNQKQLFHGSKYNNFLGILSRGLLMPKMVVNDLGITRTDIGCLGYGIYFSDSVSTSLKYTTSSTTRPGRRLLCISQVALGDSANFYSYAPNLTQSPDNFHSTHGVKKTNENNSKFMDDEFAIYHLDQQRLLYIVEVSWMPYDDINQAPKLLPIIRDQFTNRSITTTNDGFSGDFRGWLHQKVNDQIFSKKQEVINSIRTGLLRYLFVPVDIPTTIDEEVIEVAEQDYGLICPSSGKLVPLKAFHIRAQLVDVTAEVVLYQVYHNTSSVAIEAKYVFPLEENCSICGFEAHINNKIIKGVVKEKEQAKREYREAIKKGHGAYLMHQEQPEVFSVSVGNLPANCEVIIKITYVAELSIENNDIIFRLPAKVASWQSKQALEMKDQTLVPTINLEQDNSSLKSVEFSLKSSIKMPYEIMKLFSPTHRLRRKITDCLAMIELVDNILLEKDFILSITLKSVNLPRMLNETYVLADENHNNEVVDDNSQACMLTFYPKFETTNNSNDYMEIVFIIDVSNSMDGNHVQQAKQLAHLFLTNIKNDETNIYFNIITFGSDNDDCFPISSPNTKENIDKAKHFVLHSLDHRGNTDLFCVLRQYSLLPSPSKLGRQFILLSDGHINDLKSILSLLENQSSMRHDRLFTCSIGDTSNKHNLKQLANGANGGGLNTVFDSNYRSRWKTKVLHILEHIRQPCITNISIDWHGTIDNQQEKFTNQAPQIIRSLFNGMRLTVYRFIQNCHKATLTARINNQEFVTTVFSNKITETKGRILHCLTARAIIQDYENGLLHNDESENELIKKQYKQDLIELSMKYSVVSSFTSFVAIEERDGQTPLEPGVRLVDVMLERDIDILPYIGWDGDRSQIEIMKEKLLDAKRLFESASISNKIDLSNEYENLCQNISYRSGGDAKYDLMVTIVEAYRTVFKEKDKARELAEKMREDLINELDDATADEGNVLEKRLKEIDLYCHMDDFEKQMIISEGCYDIYQCLGSTEDVLCAKTSEPDDACDSDEFLDEYNSLGSSDLNALIPEFSTALTAPKEIEESDEEGDDMGFGPFDSYVAMLSPTACLSTVIKAASLETECIKKSYSESEQDDGEECDWGFSSSDDDGAVSIPTPTTSKSKDKSWQEDKESCDDLEKKKQSASSSQDDKCSSVTTPSSDLYEKQSIKEESAGLFSHPLLTQRPTAGAGWLFGKTADESSEESKTMMSSLASLRTQKLNMKLTAPNMPPSQQLPPHITPAPSALFNMSQPNYSPTSISFIPSIPPTSIPQSSLFSLSNRDENVINDSLKSERLTSLAASTATASMAPPPPPPAPNSVFSFGLFGSSATSNQIHTSSMSQPFGGPAMFSTAAAPLPPPPPPPPGSFTFSTTNASIPPFTIAGHSMFGTNAPQSLLPPRPITSLCGTPFGGSVSSSNIKAAPTFSGFGSSPMFLGATLSSTNSVLFGTSSSSTPFGAPPLFGTQKLSTPSTIPPPPPPPPLATVPTFSFSSNHFSAPQQSLPCVTGSVGTTSYSTPSTIIDQSMSTISVPPQHSSTLSSMLSAHISTAKPSASLSASTMEENRSPPRAAAAAISSTKSSFAYDDVPAVCGSLDSTVQHNQFADFDLDRDQSLLSVSARKGSTGERGGFASSKDMGRRKKRVSPLYELESELVEEDQAAFSKQSAPMMRFCDTRMDEQERNGTSVEQCISSNTKWKSGTKRFENKQTVVQDLLLLDVTPLGYGIEDINSHMCTIISRNRTIPTKCRFDSVFTNAYAYQTTATIRVFHGEHKLTKYNTFLGEFILTGLTPNFASQTSEISICMDVDANGILHVDATESRSGATASVTIDPSHHPLTTDDIERHVQYVESNSDLKALAITNRRASYMLKGETENSKISFTGESEMISKFEKSKNLELTSMMINELKRIQLTDGSFELNKDCANLLSMNMKNFDELKKYLSKQGLNSFALNIQNEIIRLIATGIILMECLMQVPALERKDFLVPFDSQQIRAILHRHLPKMLLENIDKAIDFYEQKRLRYGIYCEQLELKYSSWEELIQYTIFGIEN